MPVCAIQTPTEEWPTSEYSAGFRRLLLYIILLPVLVAGGATLGYVVHPKLAGLDPIIELAGEVRQFENGQKKRMNDEVEAFQVSGMGVENLYSQADSKLHQFAVGSSLAGGWMGLIAGGSLILNSIFWRRRYYEPHRSGCMACGRCFNSCPRHRLKKKTNMKKSIEEPILGS